MKTTPVILIAVCLFSGCASPPPTADSIRGLWHFAHVGKARSLFGELPEPPQFDSIQFAKQNRINLKASVKKWNFNGTFKLTGHELEYTFHPPDVDRPIKHNVMCSLSDRGETLTLTHNQTEMVYYRPERFYPNMIAGEWTVETEGESKTMRLGEDGSYRIDQSNIVGHYRLWPSRYGKAMTAIVIIPGHGGYFMIWKFNMEGDRLTLTPISWKGPLAESAVTWTQKKENKTPSKTGGR